VKIVLESLFLIVMSPSCGLNSCLAVKNLNIHDKSTSMSSDYGTNEHIQDFRYQCQYPIYSQVSSQGSIRRKAQFDQCKILLRGWDKSVEFLVNKICAGPGDPYLG